MERDTFHDTARIVPLRRFIPGVHPVIFFVIPHIGFILHEFYIDNIIIYKDIRKTFVILKFSIFSFLFYVCIYRNKSDLQNTTMIVFRYIPRCR